MRKAFIALSTVAFALGTFSAIEVASAAAAKTTAKGCIIGKQKWNAVDAKCVDAKPVKKAAKKAAAKKA
jgi:uncharacterized membrane protein